MSRRVVSHFTKRVHFGMNESDRQEIASAINEDERGGR
jgi:hypothetical protein